MLRRIGLAVLAVVIGLVVLSRTLSSRDILIQALLKSAWAQQESAGPGVAPLDLNRALDLPREVKLDEAMQLAEAGYPYTALYLSEHPAETGITKGLVRAIGQDIKKQVVEIKLNQATRHINNLSADQKEKLTAYYTAKFDDVIELLMGGSASLKDLGRTNYKAQGFEALLTAEQLERYQAGMAQDILEDYAKEREARIRFLKEKFNLSEAKIVEIRTVLEQADAQSVEGAATAKAEIDTLYRSGSLSGGKALALLGGANTARQDRYLQALSTLLTPQEYSRIAGINPNSNPVTIEELETALATLKAD